MPPSKNERPKGSVLYYRTVQAVLYIIYKTLFRFDVYGGRNIPKSGSKRGVIFAPNHVSYIDPPLVGVAQNRRITYLAKDYLFRHGFVGWVLRGLAAYPIKSDEGNDFRAIRDLIRLLKEGRTVVVFPEGTRSEDGQLKAPESGAGFLAYKSGAYVVPVYIEGSHEAFPKGAKKIKPHKVKIYFGEAFIPAEETRFKTLEEPYGAISAEIMAKIHGLKEKYCRKTVR
jgi:1-acyl-sn-glycerol-3-phosphate acyltransferase